MSRGAIQTGIWLIGIGILFLTNWWWPGILILIGISMLASILIPGPTKMKSADGSEALEDISQSWQAEPIPSPLGEMPAPEYVEDAHSPERLPQECSMCGGPVLENMDELEWTGRDTARCPYCGTNLPLPEVSTPADAPTDVQPRPEGVNDAGEK